MDFTVGTVLPATSKGDPLRVIPAARSGGGRDRRKKRQDRRKNVRDGIFVSLSVNEDRRRPGDRRKKTSPAGGRITSPHSGEFEAVRYDSPLAAPVVRSA